MKRTVLKLPFLLGMLVAAVVTSACAQSTADPVKNQAGSAALLAAIQSEVGGAPCDSQQQCHSAPLGAKPCGGPDAYIAWSSKQTDEKRLTALLAQYAAARSQESRQSGDSSTCMMVTNPGASCQAGRCTLRQAGFGSQPADPS